MMVELPVALVSELNNQQIDQLVGLFSHEFWCSQRTRSEVEKMLSHTDIVIGAVDTENELIGFVRVLTDYTYKAHIFDVIVRPDWRSQQLGRMLMDAVIGHPKLANVEHIDLNCLPEMHPFYEKWGFTADLGRVGFMRRFNRSD